MYNLGCIVKGSLILFFFFFRFVFFSEINQKASDEDVQNLREVLGLKPTDGNDSKNLEHVWLQFLKTVFCSIKQGKQVWFTFFLF